MRANILVRATRQVAAHSKRVVRGASKTPCRAVMVEASIGCRGNLEAKGQVSSAYLDKYKQLFPLESENENMLLNYWMWVVSQVKKEAPVDSDGSVTVLPDLSPCSDDKEEEETESPFPDLELVVPAPAPAFEKSHATCRPIQKGNYFDVISFLSDHTTGLVRRGFDGDGDSTAAFVKADSLKGKYVVLFCVLVPVKWSELKSDSLCLLSLLSSELGQRNDFEMVMVANMKKGWEKDERAFNQVFSAFSGRLAVPFSDNYSRDYICNFLHFDGDGDGDGDGEVTAILVDPDLKVLQDHADLISGYGAAGFPFTDDRLKLLANELAKSKICKSVTNLVYGRLQILQHVNAVDLISGHGHGHGHGPHVTLPWLLSCDPSFSLRKSNSEEKTTTTTVEELSKRLVGLYLFQGGDKLRAFHEVYRQCRDRKFDFEIVLVCLPSFNSINPKRFQDVVIHDLEELNISWWVFPYNNSTCLRLWSLSAHIGDDEMIIIGPNGDFVDGYGGHVVCSFGIDAYPFTREQAVQTYLKKAEAVTLESILCDGLIYRDGDFYGERVPVSKLRGKNVLVYMDLLCCQMQFYDAVAEWYAKIKAVDSDFEVVFVPLINPSDASGIEICGCQPKSQPKWLVRHVELKHSDFLYNHDAFFGGTKGHRAKNGLTAGSVLAFGNDGLIYSLDALNLLDFHGLEAYPFRREYCDLREEIIRQIGDEIEFMMDYE